MSSLSQSEFEDYMNRDYGFILEQENYEEYINNLNNNNEQVEANNLERFIRQFENYNEIVEMITYINEDMDQIRTLQNNVMEAIERVAKKREEMLSNKEFCQECIENKHKCVRICCSCSCCTTRVVSEQNKIKKGKQSSSTSNNDRLQGLNLPYHPEESIDVYDYTSEGLIELEIYILHYKKQIESSIIKNLEKEMNEGNREILEQCYTILQKS